MKFGFYLIVALLTAITVSILEWLTGGWLFGNNGFFSFPEIVLEFFVIVGCIYLYTRLLEKLRKSNS